MLGLGFLFWVWVGGLGFSPSVFAVFGLRSSDFGTFSLWAFRCSLGPFSIVLSRKVDCDVCERVAKLKITLKLAVPPSSLNTLQKERTRTV